MTNHVAILNQQFSQSRGLPWAEPLPSETIEQVLKEENVHYRNRLFSPVVTLWIFFQRGFSALYLIKQAL
nr:hypothetical protein [Acaryochloris sp. IP29b_bin.148]